MGLYEGGIRGRAVGVQLRGCRWYNEMMDVTLFQNKTEI